MKIAAGCLVKIHYDLYDQEGDLVETSTDEEPVEFVQGEEAILPGLERALAGRAAGEEVRVTLSPDDAYGSHDPDGVVRVPRADLPTEEELSPGEFVTVVVQAEEEDQEEDEGEIELRVTAVEDDVVVLDANHPLAGQDVTFVVRVISVHSAAS